jgi:hypothetical protein
VEWLDVANNIDHEFFVVRNLRPNVTYHFRLAARNRIGWSEKGIPTPLVRTKEAGMNPVCLLHTPSSPHHLIHLPLTSADVQTNVLLN